MYNNVQASKIPKPLEWCRKVKPFLSIGSHAEYQMKGMKSINKKCYNHRPQTILWHREEDS